MTSRILFMLFATTVISPAAAAPAPSLAPLGRILVLSGGRVMPMDSYARLVVAQIAEAGRAAGRSPLEWMARLLFTPDRTSDDPVFFVGHPDTLAALGLGSEGRGRYSYRLLSPGLGRLVELTDQISRRDTAAADPVESDLLRLRGAVDLYTRLRTALDFARPDPQLEFRSAAFGAELGLRGRGPHSLLEVQAARQEGRPTPAAPLPDAERLNAALLQWWSRGSGNPLKIVPAPGSADGWVSPETAALDGGAPAGLAALLGSVVAAWPGTDGGSVSGLLASFANETAAQGAGAGRWARLEILNNHARPFLVSSLLALAAFILSLFARRPGVYLLAAAFAVQSVGLAARIIITGRPPVTSLYSSFLFVAWVLLALGLFLAARRNEGLGFLIGPLGAAALVAISSRFEFQADQFGVLQAVLNTNLWLSTHVVAITLGYAGALVAGLIGHAYLMRKILRPADEEALTRTGRLLSATLRIALLFTILGTVLGGIWADQSWGRFWGWDPKENGALLIVLWMALLQHAKLARIVGETGQAAGSVLLVIVVLFSWLGVNLMGVGLHSYGWTQGIAGPLIGIGAFEALFALIGTVAARIRERPYGGLRRVLVTAVKRETPDAVTIGMTASPSRRMTCPPGRFLTLLARIDGVAYRRAYSLSSVSPSGIHFAITVRRVEGGRVSNWIVDRMKPGVRIYVGGPAGRFGLDGHGELEGGAVFVAGGSGIAPLAPMAEEFLASRKGALLLLFGSRDERHIIFRERLEALALAHPRFSVRHVIAEPVAGWTGERGSIDGGYVVAASAPVRDRVYYLCGPVAMVDDVREALLAAGVERARIHEERFVHASSGAARRASSGATIRFRKSDRVIRASPGQSVLEAGLRAGIPLPHGCGAGQCRECAAHLLSGRVSMDEATALSRTEREAGVILSCVSYAEEQAEVDL